MILTKPLMTFFGKYRFIVKAISLNPYLLDEYGAADRLLFSAEDYRDLSKSNVVVSLSELLGDTDLRLLYSCLILHL